MGHQTARRPPKPGKGPTLLIAQSHGRSFEASGQSPWLPSVRSPKPSRLGFDRSRLPILWVGIGSALGSDAAPPREPSYLKGCNRGISSRGVSSRGIFVRKFASDPLGSLLPNPSEVCFRRVGSLFPKVGSLFPKVGSLFPKVHVPEALTKRPRPAMEDILRKPVEAQSLCGRHVSLMLMPYRRAKSLLLSLYTSVLMPFTSSTTSLPSSTYTKSAT